MSSSAEERRLTLKLTELEGRELKVIGRVSALYDMLRAWRSACSHPQVRLLLLNQMTSLQRTELELATDRILAGQGHSFREVEHANDLVSRLRLEVAALRLELTERGVVPATPQTEP